jgi:hypothetical protein
MKRKELHLVRQQGNSVYLFINSTFIFRYFSYMLLLNIINYINIIWNNNNNNNNK